jgi:hypothetical protein
MFVPFIFTLDPTDDALYLWYFYKSLNNAKKNHSPMIAQEVYYTDPDLFRRMGRTEVLDNDAKVNEYDIPCQEDIDKVQKYIIPKELENILIGEAGSYTSAWIRLLKERWPVFEDFIGKLLDDIIAANEEKIEGIIVLCTHIPSLSYLAEQRGIPVIYLEWGPLRDHTYRKTGYFDRIGINRENELEKKYLKFREETKTTPVKQLSRKEILSLFLDVKFMDCINLLDIPPEYEIGIATGGIYDHSNFIYSSFMTDLDLMSFARRSFKNKDILVRTHPGIPTIIKTLPDQLDHSATSMHFICRCKRVAVLRSNITFEAMLLGRTTFTLGVSPFTFKSHRTINVSDQEIADLEFVNFVVFAYLIPFEMIDDIEYFRWRLTQPTETEIYNRNLDYYLSCRGMGRDVLELLETERLKRMLAVQGFGLEGRVIDKSTEEMPNKNMDYNYGSSLEYNEKLQYVKSKIDIANMRYAQLENRLNVLEDENNELTKKINKIVASPSWKLTYPLRRLRGFYSKSDGI